MLNGMTDHQPSSFHAQAQWAGLISLPCDDVSENWRRLKIVTVREHLRNVERTLSRYNPELYETWVSRGGVYGDYCLLGQDIV